MADTTTKLTQLKYIQRVTGKDSKGKMTLEPMIVGANAYIYTNKNILLTDAKTPTKGFGANSIYLGTGIKGTEANQLIIGQYNNSTTDIFTIGGGSSATQTKDIFTVSSNGTITQVGDYSGTIGQFRLWGKQKTAGERPMMSIYDGLDGNEDRYKSVGFVDLNEFTTISNGIHLVTQYTEEGKIYQGRGIVQVVGVLQLGTQEDDPKNKGQSICVPRLRGANGTVHIGTSDDRDKTTIHGSLEVTGTSDIAGITVGKDLTVAGAFTLGDSENGQESSWGGDIKFYTSRGHCETINLNQLKKSVSDGKSLLASTITTLGVETKEDATFNTLNTNLKKIFTTESAVGNATQAQVLSGCTFTSASGKKITGTMPNNVQYTEVETLGTAQGSGNLFIRIPYGAYLNKTFGENPEVITPLEKFGNASAFQVLENCSFTSKHGLEIKGTMPNNIAHTTVRNLGTAQGSDNLFIRIPYGAYLNKTYGEYPEVVTPLSDFGTVTANKVVKDETFTSTAGLKTKGTLSKYNSTTDLTNVGSRTWCTSGTGNPYRTYLKQTLPIGANLSSSNSIIIDGSKFGNVDKYHVVSGYTFTSGANGEGLCVSGSLTKLTGKIFVTDIQHKTRCTTSYGIINSSPYIQQVLPIGAVTDGVDGVTEDNYTTLCIPATDFGNAGANNVLSGKTFTSAAGLALTGTMENKGELIVELTPGGSLKSYIGSAGYYSKITARLSGTVPDNTKGYIYGPKPYYICTGVPGSEWTIASGPWDFVEFTGTQAGSRIYSHLGNTITDGYGFIVKFEIDGVGTFYTGAVVGSTTNVIGFGTNYGTLTINSAGQIGLVPSITGLSITFTLYDVVMQ